MGASMGSHPSLDDKGEKLKETGFKPYVTIVPRFISTFVFLRAGSEVGRHPCLGGRAVIHTRVEEVLEDIIWGVQYSRVCDRVRARG